MPRSYRTALAWQGATCSLGEAGGTKRANQIAVQRQVLQQAFTAPKPDRICTNIGQVTVTGP